MKFSALTSALLFSLVVSTAFSQAVNYYPLFSFWANFDTTGSFYQPMDDAPCSVDAVTTPYAAFNYTFPTSGVRRIYLAGDGDDFTVLLYANGFDANRPCTGVQFLEYVNSAGDIGLDFDNSYIYTAGVTYTFVVIGDYQIITGALVDGGVQGAVTLASPTYSPPYFDDDEEDSTCSTDGELIPYGWYTFTANVTGRYDFEVFFAPNVTDSGDDGYDTYIALYQGVPNATFQTDACNVGNDIGVGVSLIDAQYSDSYYSEIIYASITSGTTYTVVVSTEAIYEFGGAYAISVLPTRRGVLVATPGFDEPTRDSANFGSGCAGDSDYTDQSWEAYAFAVQPFTNISIYGAQLDDNDYEFFVYTGTNTGSSLASPSTCPVFGSYIDYEDDLENVYWTGSATTFTVVTTPYFTDDSYAGDAVDIFAITPTTQIYSVGYVPPATSTVTTATVVTSATASTVTSATASTVTSATASTVTSASSSTGTHTSTTASTTARPNTTTTTHAATTTSTSTSSPSNDGSRFCLSAAAVVLAVVALVL